MNLPTRKPTRLHGYDYNTPGAYFITICVRKRKELLSEICVGTGVLDCPQNRLTVYGKIAERQLMRMRDFYDNIRIDNFVIMPNHIHLLIQITGERQFGVGPSGTPVPTNSLISRFIGTFKRFCNKAYGENIWQSRSYDHIIRGEDDYREIWEYIDTNVLRWEEDCFYTQERS